MSDRYANILRELVARESHWLREKISAFGGKKFVIFPAGPTAQGFYHTLLDKYRIEAEFFIDNNPELNGKSVCGKLIHSFETVLGEESGAAFEQKYVVLIPTLRKHYVQIAAQLDSAGISLYMHADAFCACQLWDRYVAVCHSLADEQSEHAYWGAIYALLTGNNDFIAYESEHYFAIKEFASADFETIVDAGAYVGDTIEEYVKRKLDGLKIYGFEPFEPARLKLEARASRLKNEWMLAEDDIVVIPAGVGAKTEEVYFSYANALMLKPNQRGEVALFLYSLDDYFKDKPPFTLLKADIEGGELDMLKGAKEIIQKYKPKLALCIYHSAHDFVRIAEYVRELVPEYRLFVRGHYYDHRETVLYCMI